LVAELGAPGSLQWRIRFEDPMYEKQRDISSELLIPNLNLIPPNTISLLLTNPPFIESYMVGLNHEFGKELLLARISYR
jgi:hypothetical protein